MAILSPVDCVGVRTQTSNQAQTSNDDVKVDCVLVADESPVLDQIRLV